MRKPPLNGKPAIASGMVEKRLAQGNAGHHETSMPCSGRPQETRCAAVKTGYRIVHLRQGLL
jgi:hypothetical protein